jgi:hypothetical protein
MKKRINLFLFTSFVLSIILIAFSGIYFTQKINNIKYFPNSPYLISTFGEVMINGVKINTLPYKITKGDIIETIDAGGGLAILQNGIELCLRNSAKIIFYDTSSIELINGEISARKINNEKFTLKWQGRKLLITGESSLKVKQEGKKEYLIFNNYKKKVKMITEPSGEKILLPPGFYYKISKEKEVIPKELLPAPVNLIPVDLKNIGIEDGSNLLFKWDKSEKAKGYSLHIAYNSVFAGEKIYQTKTNFFILNITNFKNSPVYWRVSTIDKNGIPGKLSKTNRFYIKNLIQILQLWKNPPYLKLKGPLVPTGNLLIIKGKTDLGVKLTINGEYVAVDSNGNFMHIISFKTIGEHNIIITSRNLSGAETKLMRKVIIYEK